MKQSKFVPGVKKKKLAKKAKNKERIDSFQTNVEIKITKGNGYAK